MALGTGVGIIWHRQPGFGGVESCTASGSTVDDLGATSRLHVTVTLCEEPNFFPAESLDSGMTLTVNGDDTSWVLANGSADGNSITWDVETVGGNPNPISNGDVVVVDFDGSWIYPGEALQITLTNLIPAPVELLTLPAFDATTGRLDLGDFYNTRTTAETFVNSDGYVESVPANRMVYDGARIVQNLLSLYTTPISSEDFSSWGGSSEFIYTSGITDPENGNTAIRIEARHNNAAHFISIPYTNSDDRNFLNIYWLRRISGTGNVYLYTANGGWKDITTTLSTAWQRISSGSFTGYAGEVRVGLALGTSGDVIDVSFIQSEDTTAKADQDLPGEYESVGVAGSVGYGIYNRANGNSVDVNGVVTDTPGAVLATAPVLRHAPAATNQISESSPSTTYWTKRGATTIATVSEGHALGKTTQVRSLGAAGVNDFYLSMGGGTFSNSIRIEPSCLIKAVSTSGSVRIQNVQGPTYGQWTIDLSLLSTSAFGYLTRNHAAVTVNTEFTSTATGAAGLQYYAVSGSLNFDLLGVQLETGSVSTPSIKTTTAPASRAIDQILHPNVLGQSQGSIVLRVKLKPGTYTPTADRGLVTIDTAVNNMLYLNSGDSISVESADGTNTINSGVVVQSADDELGIYLSYADSTEYPASGNISVGLMNLTTWSAWAEATGNYDGAYPNTGGLLRLLSGLTCEAEILDFKAYDKFQTPAKLQRQLETHLQQQYVFEAWQPADSTWVYSSPAVRDTTETWDGNATLKIPYHATVNMSRADWKPLTGGPTCSDTMAFWFKNSTGKSLLFEILLDTSGTFASYASIYLWLPHTGSAWEKMIFNPLGHSNKAALYNTNPPALGGTFKQIQIVRMRQATLQTGNWASGDYVHIGGLSFGNSPQRPKAVITFDDGIDSIYTNRAWLSDRGIKGTCYVYPSAIGTPGYMTWAQLDELYALGWDICNHADHEFFAFADAGSAQSTAESYAAGEVTLTLDSTPNPSLVGKTVYVTGLTPNGYNGTKVVSATSGDDLKYTNGDYGAVSGTATVYAVWTSNGMQNYSASEILSSIQSADSALAARGYSTARRKHYADPQGWRNNDVLAALTAVGIQSARGTEPNYVSIAERDSYHAWPQVDNSGFLDEVWTYLNGDALYHKEHDGVFCLGGVSSVEATQTLSHIYQRIDDAIEYRRAFISLTHSLDTGDSVHHQAWLDYLVAKQQAGLIDIVTISEYYSYLQGSQ